MNGLSVFVSLVAGAVIAFGLLYFLTVTLLGIRQTGRDGIAIDEQEGLIDAAPNPSGDTLGLNFYFLIAALNEEVVIAGTIDSILQDQAGSFVVVVDDGSEDRTAEIVESYAWTGRVVLVRRTLPDARQGKGKALNAGIAVIRERVAQAPEVSTSKAIVVVMDADGQMTPNATLAAARVFSKDPSVGGVQLVVRIRNRDSAILTFQDMEFWAVSAVGQFGRVPFGSVSMGGNGQLTRLSALDEIGDEPWSESLTEDLDLGISLSVLGWRTTTTPHAYVTQQGVPDFRRLLRQRTRWYQGHMTSLRRFPELARSRYLPTGRFLELTAYLALPWCLALPWPLIQTFVLYTVMFGTGFPVVGAAALWARAVVVLVWVFLSFAPNFLWGIIYYKRSRHETLWRSMVLSNAMVIWSYVTYVAAYRALGRIVLRRAAWTKTARVAEQPSSSLLVTSGPADA